MKYTIFKLLLGLTLALSLQAVSAVETITYYHNDALGSPVAATDANGAILWKEDYHPYGSRLREESTDSNQAWYTGKHHEKDIGLTYFGARWYDPTIGRFMAIDPVGFKQGNIHSHNRYAYANNNPYLFVDPDGRIGVKAFLIASAAVIIKYSIGSIVKNTGKKATAKKLLRENATKALTKQQQKAIRSLEKRIKEHEEKLQKFKENPTVRSGMEKQSKEVIQRQQQRRIKLKEDEIKTFRDNIDKIKRGELDS